MNNRYGFEDDRFDLHSVRDTNPIVRILWGIRFLTTLSAVLVGLGLVGYFAWIVLSSGNLGKIIQNALS